METDAVLDLIRETAEAVILPRFRQLAAEDIAEKSGPLDLVTVADREAEVLIARALSKAYPDAVMLGEEATSIDPRLLEEVSDASHLFTIDPVDGTRNFVNGSPDYAVMVAEVRAGQTVRSWIHQPEHNRSYIAEAGAGAWCNGVRLSPPAASQDVATLRGVTSQQSLLREGPRGLAPLNKPWWSCGIDYPRLVSGDVDYLLYKHDWPWDHLPGALLAAELGGATSRLDGSPYLPSERRPWVITTATQANLAPVRELVAAAL